MSDLVERVALEPCPNPWCPYPNAANVIAANRDECFVRCQCGMRGPKHLEEDEAITAWNTRPAIAAMQPTDDVFRIGDRVRIVAEDWGDNHHEYVTGIDWHPKHGVTYTTSECWPPKCEGRFAQGLTDEWHPEHLASTTRSHTDGQ